ncbi:sex-determining region Y protein-like [Dermacentor silvarum]|uniref:sex-determining region Y protein-like n=1 Tax=Dermacentor silvarum TaxID=543639 RepID=UPI0018978D90|nr:sex-determining region Y protein-like [Dermacentor silvarum]
MAVPDVATHPGMAGASLSSEVQYCYQRRTRVHPPSNAITQFAQEKRRSVAAMNVNEHNRCVSSHLAKLWRPLRGADKEPLQPKIAEAVAVHRRKYPDYAHNPREAHQRKEQERIAKQVTSKLNIDSSWDKEQQPLTSTVAAQCRSGPKFQQQLPPLSRTPRSKRRATISSRHADHQ